MIQAAKQHIKKFSLYTLTIASIFTSQHSLASGITTIISIGVDSGGEKQFQVVFDDGSVDDIYTNGGVSLSLGLIVKDYAGFEYQTNFAYKVNTINAGNGELQFSSFPVEFIVAKRFGSHRVGAGSLYSLNNTLTCKLEGHCDYTLDYKNSPGLLLQYEYIYNSISGNRLGIRYTKIDLKETETGVSWSGDGIGIVWGLSF